MTNSEVGIIFLSVLVSLTLSSAPDDVDSFCTNVSSSTPPPVHPPNSRILMDSYNYINLLPPHNGPAWQMVDNDNNNLPGRGTEVSDVCALEKLKDVLFSNAVDSEN